MPFFISVSKTGSHQKGFEVYLCFTEVFAFFMVSEIPFCEDLCKSPTYMRMPIPGKIFPQML